MAGDLGAKKYLRWIEDEAKKLDDPDYRLEDRHKLKDQLLLKTDETTVSKPMLVIIFCAMCSLHT